MTPNDSQSNHGPASRVSAVPDDLAAYCGVGLRVDRGLAEPTKAFWRAMYRLRPVAARADPRIPRIIDGKADEENAAVNWLARAEQVDAWVGTVGHAFFTAARDSPQQGPALKVTVLADNLDSAIAAGHSDAPEDDLKLSGRLLRGPDGKLYSLFVPPLTNGSHGGSGISGPTYNALNKITPDDATSNPQTSAGSDPGWTVVDTSYGMTAINKPGFGLQFFAATAPDLAVYGNPGTHADYRRMLQGLTGADADSPELPESGSLPPDDPFLEPGPFTQTRNQQRVASGVDALGLVNQSLANVAHVRDGALVAYQTTYERNVDGRTRAIVRLYKIGEPPGGGGKRTTAFYGSVDKDGHWQLSDITPEPRGPETAIRNP